MTDQEIWDLLKKVELETGYDSWGRLSKLVYPVLPAKTKDDAE